MSTVDQQVAALNNLIAGVNLAQSRGTYSLGEAAQLHESVTILVNSLNSQPATREQDPTPVVAEEESPRKRSSKKTS